MFSIDTLILWFLYRIVMWLKKRKKELESGNKFELLLAYIFAFIAGILDVAYNCIIGTIIFLDFPREGYFTTRLKRYRGGGGYAKWQRRLADWFCETLLNPYDPSGKHC